MPQKELKKKPKKSPESLKIPNWIKFDFFCLLRNKLSNDFTSGFTRPTKMELKKGNI